MKKNESSKRIPILLLVFFITIYNLSYANKNFKINGIVIDALSHEPLPNASVILFEEKNNKLIKAELSNTSGHFQFNDLDPNIYILRIQYIGYEEYVLDSLVLDKDIELQKITLTPIQQNLSEINVTAIKPIIEQTATNMTVNIAESSLATGGTAYDMLQKIPGVNTKDSDISTRGKKLSLLLNGRLINIPAEEMIALLKSLPASSIEKIEINNNPTGKYDGQVQAILDIKTLKPKYDNWGTNITLGVGAGRKMRGSSSAAIYYKKNKISLSTGWDYLYTPTICFINRSFYSLTSPSYINEERDENAQEQTHNLKLETSYTFLPHHSIGFSIQQTYNPRKTTEPGGVEIKSKNSNQIDSAYKFNLYSASTLNSLSGNMYYTTTFDTLKNKELNINTDYYNYSKSSTRYYTTEPIQSNPAEKSNSTTRLNEMPLKITIRSGTADYTHTTSFGTWKTGIKTSWTDVKSASIWREYDSASWITNPSLTNEFSYIENIQAIHVGFSGTRKKTNIDISLRVEHTYAKGNSMQLTEPFTRDYINFFPTFNLEYALSKEHLFILSYRKSLGRPNYRDLNPFLRMRTPHLYEQGNIDLLPELQHKLEIIYQYHQKLFITTYFQYESPSIGTTFQEIPTIPNALASKTDLYTSGSVVVGNVQLNHSLTTWWSINGAISIYTSMLKHPDFAYSQLLNFDFALSSIIALPDNWTIEFSSALDPPTNTPFFSKGLQSYISTGIKKTFLDKRLYLSLTANIFLPYWYKEQFSYYFKSNINDDRRYVMMSISYNLGNNKKIKIKTGIDDEKNRTQ